MATVQYGSLITQLKGKVAGHVFQKGNNVNILRTKGATKNSTTSRKTIALLALAGVTSGWRNLTRTNKLLWTTAASTWPFTDKYGNIYYGSGYQMYVAYNNNLLSIGQSKVLTPAAPTAPTNPGTITVGTHTTSTQTISVPNAGIGTDYMLIFISPYSSPGKNLKSTSLRLAAYINGWSNGTISITTAVFNTYGAVPSGCAFKVRILCRSSLFPLNNFSQDLIFDIP